MGRQATLESYQFKKLVPRSTHVPQARALFVVESTNGQTREELLDFHTIEARIRLWEDECAHNPRFIYTDRRAYLNCRQLVLALTEAMKKQWWV